MNTNEVVGQTSGGGGRGSLIGSIIVVILLVIGAIYLLVNRSGAPTLPPEGTTTTTEETGQPVSNVDETESVADLEAASGAIDVSISSDDIAGVEEALQ